MPDVIVNCPQCERPLRVPEDLIGRLVKCPACGLTFSVPAAAQPQSVSTAPREPEAPISTEHYASSEEEIQGTPPRGDHFTPWENQRERARSLLMPAAVVLLLTGTLGLFIDLMHVVYVARNTWFPPPGPAQPPRDVLDVLREGSTGPVLLILIAVFAVVSILVIIAAVQMLRLRSYGFAIAGTVLAMVNFGNLCCILGLPVGIWALVILCKPEVKASFEMRSPPPADETLS